MTATLNAIDAYATDMADVRYLIDLAKRISSEPYQALQGRYANAIAAAPLPDGPHKYLDLPYWTAHKLSVARTLGLLNGPRRSLLDLGTGAGHLLRIATDHGHEAMGIDVANPTYADCAALLGVDRRVSAILPKAPLPDFKRKFDVATGIWVKFDTVGRGRAPTYWGPDEWAFLLNDLVQNHARFPFRLHFILNEHRRPDGQSGLSEAVLSWFASQGASADRSSGAVDIQMAAPQRFSAP